MQMKSVFLLLHNIWKVLVYYIQFGRFWGATHHKPPHLTIQCFAAFGLMKNIFHFCVLCPSPITLHLFLCELHKLFIMLLIHSGNFKYFVTLLCTNLTFTLHKMSPLTGCIAFSSLQKMRCKYVLVPRSQCIPFCWHFSLSTVDVNTLLIFM